MTMRRFIAWVLIWLGSITCLLAPVYGGTTGQQPVDDTDTAPERRMVLQAETLEFFQLEQRLIAEGKVTITYGPTRVFADRVELNTESGVGTAWGQVRLLTPEDDVQASRLDFNLTAEQGLLYDATGVVAQVYQVAGERIALLGPRTLKVQNGRITTCVNEAPDWEFRAREAHIGLGDYVTLKHPSFWIKGVPVFYVPYFVIPLKEERTTGFLPPLLGFDNENGATVGTEFFWAITDWMDATLGLEYLSKKGFLPTVAYRYAIDPLSDGELQSGFIRERDTGDLLWRVFLVQRQEFGWGMRGLSQLDQRSEQDPLRRYSRSLELESQVQTLNLLSLTKLFADSSLTGLAESFEAIPDSTTTGEFRRLPSLGFELLPTSILGVAFFALETSYARLNATDVADGTSVQRLNLFPRLSLPVSLAPWMRLTVTAGARATFYDHQTVQSSSVARLLADLYAHLEGPALRRRYGGGEGQRGFVHLIQTRLAYRYVPEEDQRDIPPFESFDEVQQAQQLLDPLQTSAFVDRITAANYAKVSLINRLFAIAPRGAVAHGVQEVGRLVISQGLDIRRATGGGPLAGPLDIELDVRPWRRWQFASQLRVQPATGELQEANWRVGLAIPPGWSAQIAYQHRQNPDIRYLSGEIQAVLREKIRLGYGLRFDGVTGTFREQRISFSYVAQCWSVDMLLRLRNIEENFIAGTSFFMQFNLFHL
jgi:LPS-assembly protein